MKEKIYPRKVGMTDKGWELLKEKAKLYFKTEEDRGIVGKFLEIVADHEYIIIPKGYDIKIINEKSKPKKSLPLASS